MNIFNLPDLGEGLPDAEIREWHVKEGDVINVDEPLVSMETAKAVVDVPSPQSGKIVKLYGAPGDIIETGNPLVEFSQDSQAANGNTAETKEKNNQPKDQGTVVGNIDVGNTVEKETAIISARSKATPAIRAYAKKLNIDLSIITPTGANNTITKDDVNTAAAKLSESNTNIQGEKIHGSKRAMLSIMTQSHKEICPATIMDDADIGDWDNSQDISARLVRAVIYACKQEPILNSLFDSKNQTINTSKSVHLGLAVDSKEGLFVPVIKNAEKLDLKQIRKEINIIKEEVSNRTINQEKLQGNTITLSNIGSIAVKYASPVIVPPTVAIIATGRMHDTAVVKNNEIKISKIIPLSLTFDHRCVTGGEAGRFLAAMIDDLRSEN